MQSSSNYSIMTEAELAAKQPQSILLGKILTNPYHHQHSIGYSQGFLKSSEDSEELPIYYNGEAHLATFSPTGGGKGVSMVIPNAIKYPGSKIIIDPKGENFEVTRLACQAQGQQVVCLDPFHVTRGPHDRLNPLDVTLLPNANPHDDSNVLAQTLSDGNRGTKEPFWDLSATGLFAGLLDYLQILPPQERTFGKLRDLFSGDIVYTIADILDTKGHLLNRATYNEFASFLTLPDRETRPSVLATAQGYVKGLFSDSVIRSMSESTFSLTDLVNGKPMAIFIILPPDKLRSHRALVKLWLATLVKAITCRKTIPALPTLLVLDELGQFGNFPYLETAITLLRGYGLKVHMIFQDLAQLKANYPDSWKTLLNNCGVIQCFNCNSYLAGLDLAEVFGVPADMIRNLPPSDQLLMIQGRAVRQATKVNYLKDKMFTGLYSNNPFYTGR